MADHNDQFASAATSESAEDAKSARQGSWILNWSLPQNAFWQVGVFRVVVLIGLLFYLLITL